ncbi:methyl-accepting chemotaxis protein [Hydrogenispora ethanolica]|uniref:Methyl-accepting chemotaxis protein n=1 Tax=Hydrogenispora ethanolica TaxID=1082276 RepID=A0A4R1RU20_HYDET|nr:methyl-accepting chemotaxis protein [Hydrogenispora ethanolica]TCL70055.1 methyl-accepting chemotaxis protein [Hydrogenispora ethanolica]
MRKRIHLNASHFLIGFVILGGLFYFLTHLQVTRMVDGLVVEKLDADNRLGYALIAAQYPGDWAKIDGKLYKGAALINGNHRLVDQIQAQTGSLATIFLEDTRVATTVKQSDGTRAVGTQASPEVVEAVLKRGKLFRGRAVVAGTECRTQYLPLKDARGKVVGMWFVGIRVAEVNRKVKAINFLAGAFSLLLILIGMGISLYFNRSVVRPVRSVIAGLRGIAGQAVAASDELTSGSEQLSSGSSEQAAAIEQTSATLEQSAAMIRQTSENTKLAASLSKQVKDFSDRSNDRMRQLADSMNEIKRSSAQINKIIKMIDDIAFQTNILALNAAVEAARAGESGLGFAVVAEEVRSLAQRSAEAARESAIMVESNIELTNRGMTDTAMVQEMLREIDIQVKKLDELMAEIETASQEQTLGIEQVHKAIAQMEVVTQQSAVAAAENSAAAEKLNAQAQKLMEAIEELSGLVSDRKADSAARQTAGNAAAGGATLS